MHDLLTGHIHGYYWLRSNKPEIGLNFPYIHEPSLFDRTYWVIPNPGIKIWDKLQDHSWEMKGNISSPYMTSSLIYSIKEKHIHYFINLHGHDIYIYYRLPPDDFQFLEIFGKWHTLPFSDLKERNFNHSFLQHLHQNQPDVFISSNFKDEFLIFCKSRKVIDSLFIACEMLFNSYSSSL